MADAFNLHSSLGAVRAACETIPRNFGPPGAADFRSLPHQQQEGNDLRGVFNAMCRRAPEPLADVRRFKNTAYSFKNRQIITRWIRDVCAALSLRTTTFNVAVQLADSYMWRNLATVPVNQCQLVAIGAIWIAAKFEELDPAVPTSQALADVCDRAFSITQILEMEEAMITDMRWRVAHTSATNFIYLYLHVLTFNARGGHEDETAAVGARGPQSPTYGGVPARATVETVLSPSAASANAASLSALSAPVDVTKILQAGAGKSDEALVADISMALGVPPHRQGGATLLQLEGKAVVFARRVAPASLCGPQKTSTSAWHDDGTHTARLLLRPRDGSSGGTFSECREAALVRGPNEALLRAIDVLTRECLIHVEFLQCAACDVGLAILTVAMVLTCLDTAEIAALLGGLARRLGLALRRESASVSASQLLLEKVRAAPGGVTGVLGIPDDATADRRMQDVLVAVTSSAASA